MWQCQHCTQHLAETLDRGSPRPCREIPGRHGGTKFVVASGYEFQKHWMLRSSSVHQEIRGRTEIATFFGLTAGENLCVIGQSRSPTHKVLESSLDVKA